MKIASYNRFWALLVIDITLIFPAFSFRNFFTDKNSISCSTPICGSRQQGFEQRLLKRRHNRFAPRRTQSFPLHASIAPPPVETQKKTGGDGEDGLRLLTADQCLSTVYGWYCKLPDADSKSEISAVYEEMMSMAIKVNDPANMRLGFRRYGKSRHRQIALALVKSKSIRSIAYCELRTDTSVNTGPPHFIVKLIGFSPSDQDNVPLGLEHIEELKGFSHSNAMMIEMDLLWKYKHSRILALEGSFGMAPDSSVYKEQDSNYGLVQEYKNKIRVPMVVVPSSVYSNDNTELGSYWYEGTMPDGVRFYIRQREKDQSEFDFSFDWPWVKASVGQLTGTGSVRNPTVVNLDDIAKFQDQRLKQPDLQMKVQNILSYIVDRFSLEPQS